MRRPGKCPPAIGVLERTSVAVLSVGFLNDRLSEARKLSMAKDPFRPRCVMVVFCCCLFYLKKSIIIINNNNNNKNPWCI